MVEKHFQTNMVFLTKGGHTFRRCNCNRELNEIVGAATEKARLSIVCLVLRTTTCLETDYLRALHISEKCSRLTKYVGCCVERVRY